MRGGLVNAREDVWCERPGGDRVAPSVHAGPFSSFVPQNDCDGRALVRGCEAGSHAQKFNHRSMKPALLKRAQCVPCPKLHPIRQSDFFHMDRAQALQLGRQPHRQGTTNLRTGCQVRHAVQHTTLVLSGRRDGQRRHTGEGKMATPLWLRC